MVLCFEQSYPSDVDKLCEKVRALGYAIIKEQWDAFWGQRYSSVSDPDGNQIDIFSALSS